MYTHTRMHTHTIHARTHMHAHASGTYVHTRTHTSGTYVHIHTHAYTHVHAHVRACTHAHMYFTVTSDNMGNQAAGNLSPLWLENTLFLFGKMYFFSLYENFFLKYIRNGHPEIVHKYVQLGKQSHSACTCVRSTSGASASITSPPFSPTPLF